MTDPGTALPLSAPPRPDEVIAADVERFDARMAQRVGGVTNRLARDVPSLLARVVAAEKKLAAVEALCADEDRRAAKFEKATPGFRCVREVSVDDLRAALADEVTR